MLKHGKAFGVPKVGLEESEKNCYIGMGPIMGGPESVSQPSKVKVNSWAILKWAVVPGTQLSQKARET
jgi:hypothetical protein